MRRMLLGTALLAVTAPTSAQVIRADCQHTQSQFGGEPMLVEAGSHFFADDERGGAEAVRSNQMASAWGRNRCTAPAGRSTRRWAMGCRWVPA